MHRIVRESLFTWMLAVALLPLTAHAEAGGYFDHVFEGRQRPQQSASAGPAWRFGEYSAVRLVAAEAGAAGAAHPQMLDGALLAQALARVRSWPAGRTADGAGEALFNPDEARDLAGALVQALQKAQPGQDVVFISAARRGGLLVSQLSVTGRVFVTEEGLNLIIDADRSDAVPAWRQTRVLPQLSFGSRAQARGAIRLQAEGAAQTRADWLAWPVASLRVGALEASRAWVSGAPSVPAAATAASGGGPAQATGAEPIAQRLRRLLQLREQGLITDAEYQAQRARILAEL